MGQTRKTLAGHVAFKGVTKGRTSNSLATRVVFKWLHEADEQDLISKVWVSEEVTEGRTSCSLAMRVFFMWLPKEDEHGFGKARILKEVTQDRIIKPLAMRELFTGLQEQDEHAFGNFVIATGGCGHRACCVSPIKRVNPKQEHIQ